MVFYLAEQLVIKKRGLNWCCLTFVLKQIIKLHIAWGTLLFCSSKLWIKKSSLDFVPVQIDFHLHNLFPQNSYINLQTYFPWKCLLLARSVASFGYFQGCWHQFTWKFPFHVSIHKEAHPAWAELILRYRYVTEHGSWILCCLSSSCFCCQPIIPVMVVPAGHQLNYHKTPWSVAFSALCS